MQENAQSRAKATTIHLVRVLCALFRSHLINQTLYFKTVIPMMKMLLIRVSKRQRRYRNLPKMGRMCKKEELETT